MKNSYDISNNERVSGFFKGVEKLGKATVIGLGGGGEIALHLFRSGVIQMDLIDCDKLEPGNLIRHVCGSKHLFKNKAEAVGELLDEYGHGIGCINSHDFNIFDDHARFNEIVASSDVVIVATDTDSSKFYANEMCKENNVPAVYVGMYENGCGGEVFSSRTDGPCYECLQHHAQRKEYLQKYMQSATKKDCSSVRDASAMPGLGIDQSFLSAIAARKALDILVEKEGGTCLPKVGSDLIIWSLFGIPGLDLDHLSSNCIHLEKHPECSTCNL